MVRDLCPICRSKNTVELYPQEVEVSKISYNYAFTPESHKTLRVVRCRNCSHVFCSPVPIHVYKNYVDVVDDEYLRHRKTRELTAQAVLKVIKRYVSSGKLLDVGCATGDFISQARNFGYAAEGLEPSRWSSEIARKRRIKIYPETLKSLAARYPQRYDIITMWGVIEHFENPKIELSYICKLLKPDGLLVLWTGDVSSIISRLMGRKWWYWQGQHIQYFTKQSIDLLTQDAGFKKIALKSYPFAANFEQVKNSLNRYSQKKYVVPFLKIIFTLKPIWYLYLPGEMFWIGQKVMK